MAMVTAPSPTRSAPSNWTRIGARTLDDAQMLGRAGLGLLVIALILLGSPWSWLTSAPEMLPAPWGTIGQLPPGSTGTLPRGRALFDGAATTRPALILSGWLIAGLARFGAGALRNHRRIPRPAIDAVAAPAPLTKARRSRSWQLTCNPLSAQPNVPYEKN